MSDFSLFSLFTAGLACFAPLAAAYTQPTGDAPVGNPIYEPNTGSIVPAGQDYTITWGPTTSGTVTLLLLKGPSSNVIPQYPIVEQIPNTGSYVWHVASDLLATATAEGYGIQLIDDATGQYQYSTQFGISNDGTHSNSASTASDYGAVSTSCSETVQPTTVAPVPTSTCTDTTFSVVIVQNTTSDAAPTSAAVKTTSVYTPIVSATVTKSKNGTIPAPTGAGSSPVWSVPATYASPTLSPTATSTVSPYRGDASTLNSGLAGLAVAGVAALLAL